ncbi:sulfite exporter TauE/SafE family protein [Alicyclobacillus sp.]|uniref:sulfite exporter TauE/SafE family protein n=1 Tax=Alicyclobacillus sp. TaxID=61169 RepID=UPI0025BEF618|nr:sulfite exporter TauE/SafE family protein [Alicyclobacillus sp.]MCL6515321.1 sulfite exporter TauE/SafE family protein [Alicyclobacillus sp.]
MDWRVAAGGWLVGVLIGLTGMGGGSVMTPMMIFLFHMHPGLAVGTDLVYSCITKLVGAAAHMRQRTIDFRTLGWLSLGSVPGALMGSLAVQYLQRHWTMEASDHVIAQLLGGMYILIVLAMAWRWWAGRRADRKAAAAPVAGQRVPRTSLALLGLVGGGLVGMTSVGSGALFVSVMALITALPATRLVGTDIAVGVLVTGTAGLAHLAFGNVDLPMVASLLAGSIPGILMGSRLIVRVPESVVRVGLMTLLCWSSYNLLK